MSSNRLGPPDRKSSLEISSESTMAPVSGSSSSSGLEEKGFEPPHRDLTDSSQDIEATQPPGTDFEKHYQTQTEMTHSKKPFKVKLKTWFARGGKLRPFRLLSKDIGNIRKRYISDWTTFNQLVFASAVYVFFTNMLPGITFASDLYVLTGKTWGTIEVVFSTGLCGIIFSL